MKIFDEKVKDRNSSRYMRGVSRRTIERLFDFKKTVMVFEPGCKVVRNRRYVDEIGSN